MNNPNLSKIKNEVKRRGISALYHFTKIENLERILVEGFCSRSIPHCETCVSISNINMEMFFSKVSARGGDWIIFELSPMVLWTHNCEFYWASAISNKMKAHSGRIDGCWAFSQMFEKENQNNKFPIDKAAEVRVKGSIDPSLIVDITVKDSASEKVVMRKLSEVGRDIPVFINADGFPDIR